MPDEDLRRHARESADLEARAQLLRARLRAGELSQDQLAYLAHLGDEGARLACGASAPQPAFVPWFEDLRSFGVLPWLRGIAVGVQEVLPDPPEPLRWEGDVGGFDFSGLDDLHEEDLRGHAATLRAFREGLWPWLEAADERCHARFVELFDEIPAGYFESLTRESALLGLIAQVRYFGLELPTQRGHGDGSIPSAVEHGDYFDQLEAFPRAWVEHVAWTERRPPRVPNPGGRLSSAEQADNLAYEQQEIEPRRREARERLRALVCADGRSWALGARL